jgi:hypothetical protein
VLGFILIFVFLARGLFPASGSHHPGFVLRTADFFRSKSSLLGAILDSAIQFVKSITKFMFFARTASLSPSVRFISPSVSFVAWKDSLASVDASTAACYALSVARG